MARAGATALFALLSATASAQDVERLVADLGLEKDGQKRVAAYRRLSRTRPAAALPLLAAALPRYGRHGQTLGTQILQQYPHDQSNPVLRRLLRSGSPYLELCCAVTLYRRGQRDIAQHLAQPVANSTDNAELAMMLGRLAGIDEPALQQAVRRRITPAAPMTVLDPALYYLLTTKDAAAPETVAGLLAAPETSASARLLAAAFLVAAVGGDAHATALVEALKDGGNGFHRVQRYLQQAQHLPPAVVDALLQLLATEKDLTRKTQVVKLVAHTAGQRAVPALRRLLDHDEIRVAKAAFEALASIDGALTPEVLERMLATEEPELLLVAAAALRRMDDPTGLERVRALARRPGKHRAEALRVLAGFREPGVVETLIDALTANDLAPRVAPRSRVWKLSGAACSRIDSSI